MRADSLASIITNYAALQRTWEEAMDIARDTETKARIGGVAAQMTKFDFLFGVILGELLLCHTDNLSKTLQNKSTSAAEGQHVGRMVIDTIQSLRSDESFDLFWTKVSIMGDEKWAEKLEGLDLTLERDEKWAEKLEGLDLTVERDEKWAEKLESLDQTVESIERKTVGKGQ